MELSEKKDVVKASVRQIFNELDNETIEKVIHQFNPEKHWAGDDQAGQWYFEFMVDGIAVRYYPDTKEVK